MRIAALEPYAAASHRTFLEGLARHSCHTLEPFWLPARAWKWRMRTAALHHAAQLEAQGPFDLLFVSDYVNLAELLALLPEALRAPSVVYFHENQLTYPLQAGEERDHHFALTHFYAMLVARRSLFNSAYHKDEFLTALAALLKHVPDVDVGPALARVQARSSVLPLGIELPPRPPCPSRPSLIGPVDVPLIAWNQRWEYDKDPLAFLDALLALMQRGVPFRLRLFGQTFARAPEGVAARLERLVQRIDHQGFVEDRARYLELLAGCDVFVSTARHEFFGLGTLEALRLGLHPVVPAGLAYPELLPPDADRGRFTFDTPDQLGQRLERALATVRRCEALPERRRLVQATERFEWARLAPRFDELFAEVAAEAASSRSEGELDPVGQREGHRRPG